MFYFLDNLSELFSIPFVEMRRLYIMETKYCLLTIKNRYRNLTEIEKQVADYILKNSEDVVHMSIDSFAKEVGVVKSAVIRCCKSLGFQGYAELKIVLASELSKNKQLNFIPNVSPNDPCGDILDKVFSANVKALHDTSERIDRASFEQIIALLEKAKHIYIYGIGTSNAPVNDLQYRLMQLGYSAFCYTDVPTMKISTMNIKPGDVAIGISHSGSTIATVETLRLCKTQGADTVCITSYESSPITTVCDHVITAYADEINYPVEAVSARIVHSSIVDAIAISLSVRDYSNALTRYQKSHEFVNTIRYQK